tara:strand:+ start:239 stop:949 length:711 start_codon:yes stop_codon:yes gene_type:complete
MEKTVIVVGGPNGAGKTTLARQLLLEHLPDAYSFLNADMIAEGISSFKPQKVAIRASREFLERFEGLAAAGESFVVESTFSGLSLVRRLRGLRNLGYRIEVVYLWLPDAEFAVSRVAERIRQGGHAIPVETIRRRFVRSYSNFCAEYVGVADYWKLLDGSSTPPVEVVCGIRGASLEVLDPIRAERMNVSLLDGEETVEESSAKYSGGERFYLEDLDGVLQAVERFLRDVELLGKL